MPKRKKQQISPVERRIRAYRERNRNIRAMGFADYKEYLRSELWKSIRARVLEANPTCKVCGKKATQAHHSTYRKKDLEGRDLRHIHSLCAGCHRRIEFRDHDNEKLNPAQATAKMRQLARLNASEDATKQSDACMDQPFGSLRESS